MKLTKRKITEFQSMIFDWWKGNKRALPWRRTHDPYKIMVSEIMLQQTQVSRVLPKYKEFLNRFPTARDLGNASTADVLRAWKGMGYNRRALYLKKAATVGTFPDSENDLMKLPGIGKYTARAILVFAHGKDLAMVDTNIRRIITHFFFKDSPQKESVIQEAADGLLPKGRSWEWHQALMDYGALVLKKVPGTVKKQTQFQGSKRFYRGRVIDILREWSMKEKVMLKYASADVIDSLLKDGLIEREKGMLRLPQ